MTKHQPTWVVLFLLAWVTAAAAAAGASRRQTSSRAAAQEAQADLALLVLQTLTTYIVRVIGVTNQTCSQEFAQHSAKERTSHVLRKSCAIVPSQPLQNIRGGWHWVS
jgi:hypothetical protein